MLDKSIIDLEPTFELLRPIIIVHIIREKYHSLVFQFCHHAIGEVAAFPDCQPVDGRVGKRTEQGGLLFLHDGDRLVGQ